MFKSIVQRYKVKIVKLLITIFFTFSCVWASSLYAELKWKSVDEMGSYMAQQLNIHESRINLGGVLTKGGYSGYISVREPIMPKSANLEDSLETIANKYLTEYANLLGVNDVNSLQKVAYSQGNHADVFYYDYVINGIPLRNWRIHVMVSKPGKQANVSGTITPITQKMISAARKPTLSRSQIKQWAVGKESQLHGKKAIAGKNQTEPGYDIRRLGQERVAKFVIAEYPYVVYLIEGHFNYVVNAFTGEIIDKEQGWVH